MKFSLMICFPPKEEISNLIGLPSPSDLGVSFLAGRDYKKGKTRVPLPQLENACGSVAGVTPKGMMRQSRNKVWADFTKFVKELFRSRSLKLTDFHSYRDDRRELFRRCHVWTDTDLEELQGYFRERGHVRDALDLEHAHCAARVIATGGELLPQVMAADFIANGCVQVDLLRSEGNAGKRFRCAESLLELVRDPHDLRRLRNIMHEARGQLSEYQRADRLWLALRAVSGGNMPAEARGSFDYVRKYVSIRDGWKADEDVPVRRENGLYPQPEQREEIWVWESRRCGKETFMVNKKLCSRLATDEIPVVLREDSFEVEGTEENFLVCGRSLLWAFSKEKSRVFNSPKLRLKNDLVAGTRLVELQPTQYYSYLATNDAAKLTLTNKHAAMKVRGDKFCVNNEKMLSLAKSQCSNHIGGNMLAFTSDGYLLLHQQTDDNHVHSGDLAPSCAGSLDLGDFGANVEVLSEVIIPGTLRELFEEGHVREDEVASANLMGYAVCVNRGYKPDFHAVAKLSLSLEELTERHRDVARQGRAGEEFVGKYYYVHVGGERTTVLSKLRELVDAQCATFDDDGLMSADGASISFSSVLILDLTMLIDHVVARTDAISRLFGWVRE